MTKGTGEIERTADRAELWVTFGATGSDRSIAVSRLSERVAGVESVLDDLDVEVRTRRLSVHDNWQGRRKAGCSAEQNYQLRVTALDSLDRLIAALVAAEPSALNGPNWELSDESEATVQAQDLAVADARRRAEGYALALGVHLGPLLRITDGEDYHGPMARSAGYGMQAVSGAAEMVADIAQLNLEPQLVTVTAQCTTTWSLLD